MNPLTPTILVIVGITGDLATRKLLPAVAAIEQAGFLPKQFHIVGTTRQSGTTIEALIPPALESTFLADHLSIFPMDVNDVLEYEKLSERLKEIEHTFGRTAQRLFYLSIPPVASKQIIELLGTSGLSSVPDTKLLIEKPFGVDLASAHELVTHIDRHFKPEQVYRIDHYLAKEMAQNLIVFRERNSLFRRTWNRDFIERIEILASEEIGIEGRAHFYEQTGALRDIVQSHLLQLVALTLMHPAAEDEAKEVPLRRLAALKSLQVSTTERVKRGQYQGYRDEVGNPTSNVETFVALTLESDDPLFVGIPITLVAGKKMRVKTTEIRIFYKNDEGMDGNTLILRLQPNEGVSLTLCSKRPGYTNAVEERVLDFTYGHSSSVIADAYEKVLVDAIRGDHVLFVSSDEVLESWRIIAPIQEAWSKSKDAIDVYTAGAMPDFR